MTYIADDENLDAVSFIPTRDITFVGFSIYAVYSTKDDFTCHWSLKIGDKQEPQIQTLLNHENDVKDHMCDIMFDEPYKVRAEEPIEIGVRFTVGEEFFCSTVFGYGGDDMAAR